MMILDMVIPCYNEEDVLYETSHRISLKMLYLIDQGTISIDSKVIFVDDGSTDKTWDIICELSKQSQIFAGVKLAHNRGHQNALFAGLMIAKAHADAVISMDADLQDDVNAIDEFVMKYLEGNDIVFGVRKERKKDTIFKKNTAILFYKLMHLFGVNIVYNHADYRLLSKRALKDLSEYTEVNMFLRGIIPLLGYKRCNVLYDRQERFAGESKYPLSKMINFALDGITSFTIKPIRFVLSLGIIIALVSVVIMIYYCVQYFIGFTVPGWATITISIWLFGGIQLFSIGVIGEYIGKIYMESKRRPKYSIERIVNINECILSEISND